ncbi:hypothetical protein AY601_4343 [Pedobacter cryoconitis]|uniref:Nuclear transport factor 2 family protein n=1 Tax=Pedobacter cryoconitis TaxID=188932 RepID=A0A127VIS4_9SPHI|nr:hypothetical protein [Pedobacter cryoconitis]AMQ01190.1 hypothetical protein AY601_4343 [Pedobacter cryoconitis]
MSTILPNPRLNKVHDFNQAITLRFRGEISKADINEVSGSLHQDFIMVTPDGSVKKQEDLATWLPTVFGTKPGFSAVTGQFIVSYSADHMAIIVYHEMQKPPLATNNRRSNALFIADGEGKITWRHLQGTWL